MDNATAQLNSHIELLRIMMKSYGWELITEGSKIIGKKNDNQG